jgi:hypothetical protein
LNRKIPFVIGVLLVPIPAAPVLHPEVPAIIRRFQFGLRSCFQRFDTILWRFLQFFFVRLVIAESALAVVIQIGGRVPHRPHRFSFQLSGPARMKKLSPEQRSEIARKAVAAREAKRRKNREQPGE